MKYFHFCQLALGALLSLVYGFLGIDNFSYMPVIAFGEISVALLLLLFTVLHFVVAIRQVVVNRRVFTYFPIYIVAYFVFTITWVGFSTSWAPAPADEALQNNLQWFSISGGIIAVAVFSLVLKSRKA